MTTIKDVAARAGVGLGTASRVLTGSSQTSAESRERVLTAAAELGYIANAPARSLRRSRTDVLGLIVSDIRNPFFAELAHSAEQQARHRGYTVLFANANEDDAQVDGYLRTFASQRVDGLLFSPHGNVSEALRTVLTSKTPLVLLNRTLDGVDAPMIGTDNAGGVAQALTWMQAHGHRDVAFVNGPTWLSTGAERLAAYRALRAEHGVTEDDRFVGEGDFLADGAERAMLEILDRGVRPTAVFGANGLTTMGAMRALRSRLGEEARDVALISFDDLEWFDYVSPPISAVTQDPGAIGRRGVDALVDLIETGAADSARIPTTLVDRAPLPSK
ncbi:MAG: LacI family DNA-binding transcriptional regulator [Microbacterium sp.]